jgi:Flp pilus assembly protein TadG
MTREQGTVTLWVLGLAIALMFLGGLSLDLWRAVAVRRELSAMADAAATAGANGIDESAARQGSVQLDPRRVRAFAGETLDGYHRANPLDAARVDTANDSVTVTLRDHVDFSLLGIFLGGRHFDVEVHATARPSERG